MKKRNTCEEELELEEMASAVLRMKYKAFKLAVMFWGVTGIVVMAIVSTGLLVTIKDNIKLDGKIKELEKKVSEYDAKSK